MIKFRIYALPGSGPWWLIDTGHDTPVSKAKGWKANGAQAVYIQNPNGVQPHKWVEVEAMEMHILDETAVFKQ